MVEQTSYPSWLYAVLQGATTIWERWNSYCHDTGFLNEPMNSFNHYAYGTIAEFFYRTVGGIQPDEKYPGFKHFRLQPAPGGSLTFARTAFESPYGRIESNWTKSDRKIELNVLIPPNTTAELIFPTNSWRQIKTPGQRELPDKKISPKRISLLLGSGSYSFTIEPGSASAKQPPLLAEVHQ